MADKQISQLVAASTINDDDLLVLQQGATAKKLTGKKLGDYVYAAAAEKVAEVNEIVEEAQEAVDELEQQKNEIAQTVASMAELGTDTTLTTPGMAADAKAAGDRITTTEKEALGNFVQKTFTDVAITSFNDGADDVPVKKLVVDINPVQDLHGYDNPWPAGGGKNLLDITAYTSQWSSFTVTNDAVILHTGYQYPEYTLSLSAGTYTMSCTVSGLTSGNALMQVFSNDSSLDTRITASGNGTFSATFTVTTETTEKVRLYITADSSAGVTLKRIMIESGLTATSYAPYSNICPITGWTGANVTRTGKNLCKQINSATYNGVTTTPNSDGTVTVFGTAGANGGRTVLKSDSFSLSPGTYYLSHSGTGTWGTALAVTNADTGVEIVSVYSNQTSASFTLTALTSVYVGISVLSGTAYSGTVSSQIEIGSATAFEPYSGTTYEIEFPDEAGTVYGGTLDVTTGLLTVDRASLTKNSSTMNNGSSYPGWTSSGIKAIVGQHDTTMTYYTGCNVNDNFKVNTTSTNDILYFLETDIGLSQEQLIALAIDIQVVAPLATPVTYQCTPAEVRTLLRQNNILADTGNINTLIYRVAPLGKDEIEAILHDYESMIAGIETTGKASQNYSAGAVVIANGMLLRCLSNVASGETFTIGAGGNCTQTTVADELMNMQLMFYNYGNLAYLSYTTVS